MKQTPFKRLPSFVCNADAHRNIPNPHFEEPLACPSWAQRGRIYLCSLNLPAFAPAFAQEVPSQPQISRFVLSTYL